MSSKAYRSAEDEFVKTYAEPISGIAKANNVDLGVAADMFKSNINGGSYAGGGVMDMTQASSDYNRLLELAKQDGSRKLFSSTESSKFNPGLSPLLSRDQAMQQAAGEIDPQIRMLSNQVLNRILESRGALPQNLAQRGQAVGGQRELAEQNLSTQEALQMSDLQLQGLQAKNDYANDLMGQNADTREREYNQAWQVYQSELDSALNAENTAYNRQQDSLDRSYNEQKFTYQQEQDSLDRTRQAEQDAQSRSQFWANYNRLSSGGGTGTDGFTLKDFKGRIDTIMKNIQGDDTVDDRGQATATEVMNYLRSLEANEVDEATIRELMKYSGLAEVAQSKQTYSGSR